MFTVRIKFARITNHMCVRKQNDDDDEEIRGRKSHPVDKSKFVPPQNTIEMEYMMNSDKTKQCAAYQKFEMYLPNRNGYGKNIRRKIGKK